MVLGNLWYFNGLLMPHIVFKLILNAYILV